MVHSLEKFTLFPTEIYSMFIDVNLNPIINYLYFIKSQDKGVKTSNIGGWHSQSYLHLQPELNDLNLAIKSAFRKIKQKDIHLTSMWGNISSKYHYNTIHSHGTINTTHTNTEWSGCFYLQIPEQSGAFRIHNRAHPSQYNDIFPKPGALLIFNSDVHHSVLPNLSDKDRISIAFNFVEE
jgi:uncharacterized protein (TIGR02466 family)